MGFLTQLNSKKKLILIVGVCFSIIVLLSLKVFNSSKKNSERQDSIRIGTDLLSVESAKTPEEIMRGLSYRTAIGSDGLLFTLPSRTIPSFWMKGMLFDLDFVWIDKDTVVDLTVNVRAAPEALDSQLQIYTPRFPVTHVLELQSGEVKRRGIAVGDRVEF